MRRLCAAFAALLLLCTAVIAQDTPAPRPDRVPAPAPQQPAETAKDSPAWDWVLFYYMGYDNNLGVFGRPILDMLNKGITGERVAVITVADFRGKGGMKRYEATKAGEKETALDTEDAADETTLKTQLEWTSKHYPAARYAVVFLDHGGRLSEMSHDETPGPSGRDWLHVVKVAEVIANWRKDLPGRLEHLFVQQCGKGALENYHAFAKAAPWVMASQTVVGAPNYYYTEVVKALCAKPDVDGKELAALIQKHETDNMFTTYTLVNNAAMEKLPEKLNAVLKPLLELETLRQPAILAENPRRNEAKPEGAFCRRCFQPANDESFVDGLALLRALYDANGLDKAPCDTFAAWVKEDLVALHRVSPRATAKAGDWCGFSLYVPSTKAALERYKEYPIYKDTKLKELMARLVK
ncbi:MAG: hypothetical protein HS108_09480 [Planctomycetes bacterium]|nr:hypothetical protein [Planctomycetota bacterium]MCL4729910.1 hypothetical protein [Planctomycetota bacterium]